MSLTNPNTPVSQQDLQDFYHKLLPYMGGSFGLVATGIDSANLYSTTERVVGQWIDGKPLYQKSIILESNVALTSNTSFQNIVAIDMTGKIPHSINLCRSWGNDIYAGDFEIYCPGDANGYIQGRTLFPSTGSSFKAGTVITIQYTKTTDSAVDSYGTDTTYSTDEHVVGSWIDGRPVYQKTITGTAPSSSSTQNIQIGANVENVLVIGGYCQHDSFLTPINAQVDTNEYLMVWVRNNSHPTVPNTLGIKVGSALYSGSYNITLQYTKPSST